MYWPWHFAKYCDVQSFSMFLEQLLPVLAFHSTILDSHCLLTFSAHAREGYSSHFVCLSVCLLSVTDLEDGGLLARTLKEYDDLTPINLQTVKCRHTTLLLSMSLSLPSLVKLIQL